MKYYISNVCLHDGFFLTKIVKRLQKEFGIFAEKLHPEVALQKCSSQGVLKIYSKFTLHPCQSVISIKLLCEYCDISEEKDTSFQAFVGFSFYLLLSESQQLG